MLHKLISIIIFINSSLLFSAIVLDIGITSHGDGIYDDGEMYNDANENDEWDDGEAVWDDTLEIIVDSDVSVRGFQFDVYGMDIGGGYGGVAETNGFDIYAAGDTVLGFGLGGQVIPGSAGILTTLYGIISDEICFPFLQGDSPETDTPIFADEDGNAFSDITLECGSECAPVCGDGCCGDNETEETCPQDCLLSNHENLTFNLFDVYPNPFNPELNISLNIEQNDHVKILVYNITGQLIHTVYNGFISGNQLYNFTWDASNFSSGIYIIKIDSEHLTQSKIVNLLK